LGVVLGKACTEISHLGRASLRALSAALLVGLLSGAAHAGKVVKSKPPPSATVKPTAESGTVQKGGKARALSPSSASKSSNVRARSRTDHKTHASSGGDASRKVSANKQLESQPPVAEVPPEIRALGPLSVGHPAAGYLVNAVPMPPDPDWVLTAAQHGFATQETVDGLSHCIHQVHERFAGSEPTKLGSLSAIGGGHVSPHKSHRTGRDADVYFFRLPGAPWNKAATRDDLDLPRTWSLLRCFITDTDVDMILIDRKVQAWIEDYALASGEPRAWVEGLFHDHDQPKQMAVVRHEPGHVAHMHVRFSSPKARRAAVQAYDRLVSTRVIVPPVQAIDHTVRKGETLSSIAKDFHVSVERIRALNGIGSSLIRVGQVLTLQRAVDIQGARDAVGVPARRLPPVDVSPAAVSGVAAQAEPELQPTPDCGGEPVEPASGTSDLLDPSAELEAGTTTQPGSPPDADSTSSLSHATQLAARSLAARKPSSECGGQAPAREL
ncbi:MAG TPA: penicillin-insensitive murein endopeptidase, partial [Polyangiaceae bacterium]|nr:penicillin-insensitive murein endopeptidase [Polyangiaceae bacterium]